MERARLALVPLLVIAVGFFLPPIGREAAISRFAEDGWRGLLMPPIHLSALLLAILTVAHRRAPGAVPVVAAVLAIVASGALLGVEVVLVGFEDGAALFTLGAIAIGGLAIAVTVIALRRSAWQRWGGLLAAYGIAISYYGCPRYLGMFNLFSGGVVFILADLTLIVLALRALRAP